MALRKIGKYYYTYFRDENGKLRTLATGQTVEAEALKLDRANLARIRNLRQRKIMLQLCTPEEQHQITAAERTPAVPDPDQPIHQRGTVRLDQMFDLACKYRPLNQESHLAAMRRFIEATGLTYADEVTPKIALNYLRKTYGSGNGKSYNNNRTYLNTIFKLCLIESGLKRSPFEDLLNMRLHNVETHRPLTDDEFLRLFTAANEPWKTAMLISWYTGLREMDCLHLKWSAIQNGWIHQIPKKTKRYKRAVLIPIHPDLQAHLDTLPPPSDPDDAVLKPYLTARFNRIGGSSSREIRHLFKSQNVLDTEQGKASFHSLRASFITRCEEAGIPRHAIRGMVGHVDDKTTDTYSQDQETPKLILRLPSVCKNVCKK